MATVALAKLLQRPVKFVADRFESFVTDIHARDHRVKARIGVKRDGTITAFEIDDLTGIGPYSVYPPNQRHRGQSGGQSGRRAVHLPELRARARVVFQNQNVMCQYRGSAVGHPIATASPMGLVELAAAKIGMDPRSSAGAISSPTNAYPATGASGHQVRKTFRTTPRSTRFWR